MARRIEQGKLHQRDIDKLRGLQGTKSCNVVISIKQTRQHKLLSTSWGLLSTDFCEKSVAFCAREWHNNIFVGQKKVFVGFRLQKRTFVRGQRKIISVSHASKVSRDLSQWLHGLVKCVRVVLSGIAGWTGRWSACFLLHSLCRWCGGHAFHLVLAACVEKNSIQHLDLHQGNEGVRRLDAFTR